MKIQFWFICRLPSVETGYQVHLVVGLVVFSTGGGFGVGAEPLKNIEQAH